MLQAEQLADGEREAIHELMRGTERIHRAHGALLECHHAVGRGMEHYRAAAEALADDHDMLADRIDDEVHPAGLTEEGHRFYELVREFEAGFLATVESVHEGAVDELADGDRGKS